MAQLRTTGERRRLLNNEIGAPWVSGFFIALILFGLLTGGSAVVSSLQSLDFNNARVARISLIQTTNGLHGDARKQFAQSMIYLEHHSAKVNTPVESSEYGKVTTNSELAALQKVADTGQDLKLPIYHYHWIAFRQILKWSLPGALLAYMLVSFVGYLFQMEDYGRRDRFIVDLPWSRFWPVVFVATTPIGWPFYIVSAIRLRKELKSGAVRDPEPVHPYRYDEDDLFDHYVQHRARVEVAAEEIHVPKPPTFTPAPKAALLLYSQLRSRLWREATNKRKRELERKLAELPARIQEAGEHLRTLQQKKGRWKAEQAELDLIDSTADETVELAKIQAEFDRLTSLHGVKAVRVINDSISLLVEARIERNGSIYDLGDWDLRFNAAGELSTKELRSGVRGSWNRGYPVYRLSGGTFCFGSRATIIHENLAKGQFLQAMELAVNSMCSVNEIDIHLIPRAFKKIESNA